MARLAVRHTAESLADGPACFHQLSPGRPAPSESRFGRDGWTVPDPQRCRTPRLFAARPAPPFRCPPRSADPRPVHRRVDIDPVVVWPGRATQLRQLRWGDRAWLRAPRVAAAALA